MSYIGDFLKKYHQRYTFIGDFLKMYNRRLIKIDSFRAFGQEGTSKQATFSDSIFLKGPEKKKG